MAFKSIEDFNDDRYKGLFRLPEDGDTAQVIFLYRSKHEMLTTNAHYINSEEYRGYVHCLGTGCPACAKNIKLRPRKVFIPLYVVSCPNQPEYNGTIKFWDRTAAMEQQLNRDVFRSFPNPSEFIFTIVRRGAPRDINTTYDIRGEFKNTYKSYDQICAEFGNIRFVPNSPDDTSTYYENICKTLSSDTLSRYLSSGAGASSLGDYVATPRAGFISSIPDTYVESSALVTDNTPTGFTSAVLSAPDANSNIVSSSGTADSDDEYPEPTF